MREIALPFAKLVVEEVILKVSDDPAKYNVFSLVEGDEVEDKEALEQRR